MSECDCLPFSNIVLPTYINLFCIRLQEQIECERVLCDSYLISICVRLFLEKYENDVATFCDEFQQLTLVDEKYDHLINFLQSIYSSMSRESMWQGK